MTEHADKLDRKKTQAISALLMHPTIERAAQAVGVTDRTLWRWLQEPDFATAYQRARNEVLTQSLSLMHKATGTAVATLIRNLKCGNPSVEVRAAIGLLDQTYKGREHLETEDRLSAIERLLEETGASNKQQRTGYHRG